MRRNENLRYINIYCIAVLPLLLLINYDIDCVCTYNKWEKVSAVYDKADMLAVTGIETYCYFSRCKYISSLHPPAL